MVAILSLPQCVQLIGFWEMLQKFQKYNFQSHHTEIVA